MGERFIVCRWNSNTHWFSSEKCGQNFSQKIYLISKCKQNTYMKISKSYEFENWIDIKIISNYNPIIEKKIL